MAKYLNDNDLELTLKDGDGNKKWFIVGTSSEWDSGTHLVSVKNFFTYAMPAVCRSCGEPIPSSWANSGWLYDHNYRWTCPNCGVLNKRGDAVGVYTAYGSSNTGSTRLLVEGALVQALQNMDYTPKSQSGTTSERSPGITPGCSYSCTVNLINVSGTTSASFVGGSVNSNGWTITKVSNTQYRFIHYYDARISHETSSNDYNSAFPTTYVKFHATGVVNDLTVPIHIRPEGRGTGYTNDGSYLMKVWFHGGIYINPNSSGLSRFRSVTHINDSLQQNDNIPVVPFPGSDVYNGNINVLWSFTSINITNAASYFDILYVAVLNVTSTNPADYYGMYNNPNWVERSTGFNARWAMFPASATTSNPYARFVGLTITIDTSSLDTIPSWRNNGLAAVVFHFGSSWIYPGTILHSYPTFLLSRTSVDYFGYCATNPGDHYTWFY